MPGIVAHPPTMARFHQAAMRYDNGPEVLHDISLDLPSGAFRFLLGPSGAGKTSLLRLLSLAMKPSRGTVEVFGSDVTAATRPALAAMRRKIGVVFQGFRLLPQLSVRENVALPLAVAGGNTTQVALDTERMLERIGLKSMAESRPAALSGGQQQLVAIARALIVRPRLLIADEPTASVDERLALRLIAMFREINRLGTTVLIATHNERLAEHFPYPTMRLESGRIVYAVATADMAPTAEPAATGQIPEPAR